MFKNEELLKDLVSLNAIGGSPYDYFIDQGISEVALYGNDDLLPIMWSQAYWNDIKIGHVFGQTRNYNIVNGEKIRSNTLKVESDQPPEDDMPIILLDNSKEKYKNSYQLRNLINYSRIKRLLLDKLLKYKEDHPGVDIVLANLPVYHRVKYKTDAEKEYLKSIKAMSTKQRDEKMSSYLSSLSGVKDYGQVIKDATFDTVKNEEGVYFLGDKTTKYVNVKDGYRLVPSRPETYEHTIYTFGNSLGTGYYTDDEHTIQNGLQSKLNDYYGTNNTYGVVNTANGGHPNYKKIWESVEFHAPQDGDMIVILLWFNPLIEQVEKYRENFIFSDVQKSLGLFDRPHSFGEQVWIDDLHLQYRAYKQFGESLANDIIDVSGREIYPTENWSVEIPNLDKNKHWILKNNLPQNSLDFIRKNALTKEPTYVVRWLSFESKIPLKKGRHYKVTLKLKYSDDTKVNPFFYGNGIIEKIGKLSLEKDKWTEVDFDFIPNSNKLHTLAFSASDFMSAGSILSIGDIQIEL